MSNESSVRYVIDAEDKISFVDEEWSRFAEANDGVELMGSSILGRSLWDYITDTTTRNLYQQIVAHVRQGKSARFSLRCDGPDCRRLLEMKIRATPDGSVEFETYVIKVDFREPLDLLSRSATRSTDLIRVCGWCSRVDVGFGSTDWVEVEEAMERLRLFELRLLPQLTHGICEACFASMMGTLSGDFELGQ